MTHPEEEISPEGALAVAHGARTRTWEAVQRIAEAMRPGMTEVEAIKVGNGILAEMGARKFWHKTHVRFGPNTVLSFNDPYTSDYRLKEDDIFYVDIGPVWNGVEGDAGETFSIGNVSSDCSRLIEDSKSIFEQVRGKWLSESVSGQEMFEFAKACAQEKGYLLHPTYVKGHRIAEFSHSIYTKLATFDVPFKPASERWVLEVQICDPEKRFGAFYEDILLS